MNDPFLLTCGYIYRFPASHFSRLNGIMCTTGAFFSLFQSPLFYFEQQSEQMAFYVSCFLLSLSFRKLTYLFLSSGERILCGNDPSIMGKSNQPGHNLGSASSAQHGRSTLGPSSGKERVETKRQTRSSTVRKCSTIPQNNDAHLTQYCTTIIRIHIQRNTTFIHLLIQIPKYLNFP